VAAVNTADLPATPVRDRVLTAAEWVERPESVPPEAVYRRRIGRWLLWRTGPSRGGDTTYVALDPDDLTRCFTFRMDGDTDEGVGPSGVRHDRFRTWKEDLRDTP
jgi:hypothetical protein